jgi:hypothetical protein
MQQVQPSSKRRLTLEEKEQMREAKAMRQKRKTEGKEDRRSKRIKADKDEDEEYST